jgi:hypothetical protein
MPLITAHIKLPINSRGMKLVFPQESHLLVPFCFLTPKRNGTCCAGASIYLVNGKYCSLYRSRGWPQCSHSISIKIMHLFCRLDHCESALDGSCSHLFSKYNILCVLCIEIQSEYYLKDKGHLHCNLAQFSNINQHSKPMRSPRTG